MRVFAALGSFMSAGLIAFTLLAEPWAWVLLRLLVGFCMSGIYVAAESWLNDAATNENRGKVLSAYMIAQTLGIIGAQGLLTLGDAGTAGLFIVASILVSISFAPILLSVSPAPVTEVARPMSLRKLFARSPLGTVGIFPAWQRLCHPIGHGPGLRHEDRTDRITDLAFRCDAVRRGAAASVSYWLAF